MSSTCHYSRRRTGFTLLELLIAIALGSMLLIVVFIAVQTAVRTMSMVNRIALENRMMRAGVQAAFDDADFWTSVDDPLDATNQGLRGALTSSPDTREAMAYAPKVTFGQPFTPLKNVPQPAYDDPYAGGDVANLTDLQRWMRTRPPTEFSPIKAADYSVNPSATRDPLLEPDWTYAIDPSAPTSLEVQEERARTLDQSRGLDPWRPYQANDPKRWFRGLPTEQPTSDRRNGRYGLMSNLRSFPVAGFGSDPRWARQRIDQARLERPGDLVPSGPFGPYYGWTTPLAVPVRLQSDYVSLLTAPAPPPQGQQASAVAPDPSTGRLTPPPASGTVVGQVRQTAWTWYGNQMTWLRDAFGDYGMLDYLPSNVLLQSYGMRIGLERSVSVDVNYQHQFQDVVGGTTSPVANTGTIAGMPSTYAYSNPTVSAGVWYPASSQGTVGALGDLQQGWVNAPDASNYAWVDEAMDLRMVGTGQFRRPDNSLGRILPGMSPAYSYGNSSWGWNWGTVATNNLGSFSNSSWGWAIPLVPFSAYTGGFVTGRGIGTGVWNQYSWGDNFSQSTAQFFTANPQLLRATHRRRWSGATANSSMTQADLENRSMLVKPLMPQRPDQWPALQVSSSRVLVKAREMNVYKVRWSDPVTGQVAELDFKIFGTSLRGARQQRHRDGGWARFTTAESDPFRSVLPADDNSPTLDSPTSYDPSLLRHK